MGPWKSSTQSHAQDGNLLTTPEKWLFNLCLKTFSDEVPTASGGRLLHCLITFKVRRYLFYVTAFHVFEDCYHVSAFSSLVKLIQFLKCSSQGLTSKSLTIFIDPF